MTFEARVTVRSGSTAHRFGQSECPEHDDTYTFGTGPFGRSQQCFYPSSLQDFIESLIVRVPTGGSPGAELRYGNPDFSGVVRIVRTETSSIRSAGEMVASIKSFLGVNLVEVARILRVQRPTIYAWLDGSQEPRDANLRRLNRVFVLVTQLSKDATGSVGLFVRKPDEMGTTLLDLLETEPLDDGLITTAVARIRAAMAASDAKVREQRLRPSGVTAKSSAMEDASVNRAIRKFSRRGRR